MNSKIIFAASCITTAVAAATAGYIAGRQAPSPTNGTTTIDSVIGSVKGTPLTRKALTSAESFRLYEAEVQVFNAASRIVEERFLELFFDEVKKEKNLSSRQQAQEDFFHNAANVSEARVSEVVAQFGSDDRLKSLSDEEKKREVRRALEMQESEGVLRKLILGAKQKGEIAVSMPEPAEPPVDIDDGGNPFVGPKDAKVTIIEFADYECPFCARVVPTLWDMVKKYEGKVRWVFRDYVLPFHKQAMPAALAANCAGAQGKYFEAHNFLFENHSQLGEDIYKRMAETLKLNMAEFDSCRTSDAQKAEIENDIAAGNKAGVNGTPTYFVNGKRMKPGASAEAFSAAIEAAL
jgi:protein-disulfide isomerase